METKRFIQNGLLANEAGKESLLFSFSFVRFLPWQSWRSLRKSLGLKLNPLPISQQRSHPGRLNALLYLLPPCFSDLPLRFFCHLLLWPRRSILGPGTDSPNIFKHDERLVFKNAVFSEHEASKMANLISRRQELKKCYQCNTDHHFFSCSASESAQSKLGRGWEWNQEVCQLDNSAQQISTATRRIGHSKQRDQKCNTWQGSIKQSGAVISGKD